MRLATTGAADTMTNDATINYLERTPADDSEIPSGHVLVHNPVKRPLFYLDMDANPTRRLGSRGFRAWTQTLTDRMVPCDCGWAQEVQQHYRVAPRVLR